MSLAAKEYTPEELDALEAQAKQRPVYDQIAGGVGAAMAYYEGPQETKAEYTPEELDVRDALYAQPELTPEELDQRLVNAKYDANTLLAPEQLKEADAVEKRLRDQGKQPGIVDTAFALGGGILQSVADWNMALDKGGNVKAAVKNALIKTGVINGDYERMPMVEAALQAPASAKAGIQGATLNAMETAIALNGLAKGKPRYRVKETGEFVFAPLGGVAPLTQLAGEGKTLVPVTDADLEEHRYQQYATENAIRKTYLDVTSEEVLGQAPNQSFTLPVEIAADPWNLIAFGAANKVTGAARMGKLFSAKTLGAAEAVAGGSANVIDKGADVFTKAVQKMSFGLLKRDTQRAIAKSAAYGGGAAAIGTMLTNAPSEARNAALTLMSLYPMYKMGSGVLRRVEGAAGTGKLIMREAADATNGLDDVARAAVASNPRVPQQIREVLANPSRFTPIESTPARIAKSEAFSPRVREVAARLANPLVVQASRAAGATARGAAVGTVLNIPFAEAYREMGDERTADSVYAGGLLFGAAGGLTSRVAGAKARRRDAAVSDIGRMLVDIQKTNAGEDIGAPGVNRAYELYYSMAEPGRMLTDVELAGGDIDALLRNTKFEDLAGMAAMQGFYRDTVDFVPLNAFDYEANVKALGGTGTAGYFLHAPEGQRARLFLNADARRTDVAPHEYGHALLQSAATSPDMKNSARAFINQRYGPERLDAMAREYATQLIKNRNAKAFPNEKLDVSEGEIDSMIYELGEAGLSRGDADRLDWLRDEIFAEEHRAAGIEYAQIRRNIPDGFSVVGFAENVLGANARALGVAGVPIDPQTGALRTPPDRLFKDNPLLAADAVMRRNVQQYVRAYKQWLNDPAHEVPTGAAVSRTGNPNELKNNPNVTFRDYGNGRLENELAFIDESGNVKVKDKKNDPERAKFIRARQQQVREMIDRGTKEPSDPTFGARVRDGRRIVAGKKLPPRFDMTRFPGPLKELARRMEALAEAGETMQVRYFALGKSKDVFKQGDIRGVQAINREVMFVEWQATKDGNINAFVVDLTQFRNRAMKAIADRDPSLSEINWDFKQLEADLRRVLDNHANGRAGADGIGDKRRNAVNALLGIGTKTNRLANPLTGLGGKGSALKTLRLDAFDEVAGTGRQGFEFDYQKANGNFMPDQPAPRPNMDSDLELPNRMPSALPQAGMAMPEVPANLSTDQILRELEENQGYLGLSTLGMREGRPVKGGAQRTRELLKRNDALNEELRRRGGTQEESDVQRVLRQRGQAMPDVAPTLENFDAAQQATGGTLRPIADQPENAPIAGRLTPEQSASIDELQEYYRSVTPQRIKELQADAVESLASRLINKGIPVTEANDMAKATFRTLRSRVNGAMQVISGMGTSDLSRMAGTGRPAVATRKGVNPNWLTSAFEAFSTDNDLALMKAQQVARQLNKEQQAQVAAGQSVDAARASGVRSATIDQGMQFVIGEKTADQKAFGSSLREDPSAPPRVYASVVEGQKFGSQGNYNVFFEWKKDAPLVITSHHHYGVGNGLTDIHASANIGDKNARSFGDPQAEVYDTLPSGKKVLRTRLLVGNAGAADIRAHQLMVSIPESALSGIKKKGVAGARAELNRIAISQLVGSASQGKTQSFTSKGGVAPMVAIQRNRTEAYVLNPDLKNVASITIVSNSPKETALIKKNLANAFKNNGSPLPRIKVVSAESGPSGNPGRKKITDEFFNLTGKVVYGAALGGAAALAADESQQ